MGAFTSVQIGDAAPAGIEHLAELAGVATRGRSSSRRLRDVIRAATGGNALHLVGPAGLTIIEYAGPAGALAIGAALRDWRSPSRDELEAYKGMVASVIGQSILDGLCSGPLYSASNRRAAIDWSEEMELLLITGPLDARDAANFEHMQLLADAGGFPLTSLSALLRASFDTVERDRPIAVPDCVDGDFIQRLWMQQDLFASLPEFDRPTRPRSATQPRRAAVPASETLLLF